MLTPTTAGDESAASHLLAITEWHLNIMTVQPSIRNESLRKRSRR